MNSTGFIEQATNNFVDNGASFVVDKVSTSVPQNFKGVTKNLTNNFVDNGAYLLIAKSEIICTNPTSNLQSASNITIGKESTTAVTSCVPSEAQLVTAVVLSLPNITIGKESTTAVTSCASDGTLIL